jgi:hypothetical protein
MPVDRRKFCERSLKKPPKFILFCYCQGILTMIRHPIFKRLRQTCRRHRRAEHVSSSSEAAFGFIQRYADQPRTEPRVSAKRSKISECLKKGVLNDVLGIDLIAKKPYRDAINE